MILAGWLWPGLGLHAAALGTTLAWARRNDSGLPSTARLGPGAERLGLVLILCLAFGLRMVQAGAFPAVIDGDELKWSVQAYFDMQGIALGDLVGQADWTPTSFVQDQRAFAVIGPDINSPRKLRALLSVIATAVFYLLVRRMFGVPVALCATLFMASSYFDVMTSRQAVVETFTKAPAVLAMYFLVRGVDRGRWLDFRLSGEGYLLDAANAGETRFGAIIPLSGRYEVCLRYLTSTVSGEPIYVSVGDQSFEPALYESTRPMLWTWRKLGGVDLEAGPVGVTLSRGGQAGEWQPLLFDPLALSPDPEFDPEVGPLWSRVYDSGELPDDTRSHVLRAGLGQGQFAWRV